MKLQYLQRIKTSLTLVQLKAILKVGTISIHYHFVQKNIYTILSCEKIFGHFKIATLNLVWSGKWKQKQCLISAVHENVTCALLKKYQTSWVINWVIMCRKRKKICYREHKINKNLCCDWINHCLVIASFFKNQLNCVIVRVSVECYSPVKVCFY